MTMDDYSADEFENEDDAEAEVEKERDQEDDEGQENTLGKRFVVSMGADEDPDLASLGLRGKLTSDHDNDTLQGTSRFGGGLDGKTGGDGEDDLNDSFEDAFEKGDESQPPAEDDEAENFVVSNNRPKR